eukprot:405002-Pelagomonas_calceolata.AAC.1
MQRAGNVMRFSCMNARTQLVPSNALHFAGLENMTEDELRMACRARGMRTPYGQGAVAFMERQLRVSAFVKL